ncbi:AraC family transcriptional regulator [Anaeromicropila populeti]|uniref:AraC-type DNA-binding protein n=1 Tax=Anaeromicropila populeti TaxID=37658 RepID=A0A1I6LM30_9FIRM|nr:AraC family transcriptional regulator [Anaeromicropila populeti]SFS04617.1 AraC-type DNA-binding protein [Anaeromicropila populeti]
MQNFEKEYLNAVITKREPILSAKNSPFSLKFVSVSCFALQNLFYMQNFGTRDTQYPFLLELEHFNSYLVLYTKSGKGKLSYKNEFYILHPDTVLFINCSNYFKLELFESSNWSFDWIYLNGFQIQTYFNLYCQKANPVFSLKPLSQIPNLIKKLISIETLKITEGELITSMLITNLLTHLILEKETSYLVDEKIPAYVLKIKELFDTKYQDNYTLHLLSAQFHVSKFTLTREFSKYIHSSPIDYLIQRRISVAQDLLRNTDLPVNEIALNIGIDNPTHFINLFKKRIGLTPLQYRNQKNTCTTPDVP